METQPNSLITYKPPAPPPQRQFKTALHFSWKFGPPQQGAKMSEKLDFLEGAGLEGTVHHDLLKVAVSAQHALEKARHGQRFTDRGNSVAGS